MTKKKSPSPFGKKKVRKTAKVDQAEENLDRFAGSSDEEDEDHRRPQDDNNDKDIELVNPRVIEEIDANEEESAHDDGENVNDDERSEEPFVTNADSNVEEEPEPGMKMAGVMAQILGMNANLKTASVVLAKTTTPLQRLQQTEKEKTKALKLKRKANKERNLAALHIPLSVATTNNIGAGRVSISKELEQERFHRRVATRGVVALFNAISQHQNVTENDDVKSKKTDAPKMTKHGFLDKIKTAAATMDSNKSQVGDKLKAGRDKDKPGGKWDALKDDFMMKPKKNWDEESSDENSGEFEEPEEPAEFEEEEPVRNKRRKVGAGE